MSLFRSSQAVGLHRFWVMPAEAVHVLAGFVMVCPLPVLRVACADKLHNAECIARDFRESGPSIFQRFRGDREGTLWYYRSLARIFGALIQDHPDLDPGFRILVRDLRETVASLEG